VPFISRDIGPSWAVPLISAGGAVDEPLLDLDLRVGVELLEALRPVGMRLLSVSEPTLENVAAHPAHGLVVREVGIELGLPDGQPGRDPGRHRQRGQGSALTVRIFICRLLWLRESSD